VASVASRVRESAGNVIVKNYAGHHTRGEQPESMSALIGKRELRAMLASAIAQVRDGCDYLSHLDAVGGDGDHGATMRRAMREIEKTLAAHPDANLSELLTNVGWALLGIDGGATGPLLGSFFLGVADGVGDRESLDTLSLARAFEKGCERVQNQSKAQVGDKTMLDALLPALAALRASAEAGDDSPKALANAAEAAARGADATKNWLPKFGKARFSGERTRGHSDPGAASVAMIFAGFSAAMPASAARRKTEPGATATHGEHDLC
jgi:phosphoenolpyruvate---glycerone phosphotransferase subunit DhaL